MAQGFFVSKTLVLVGVLISAAALATIIALAVVYAQEKQKNSGSDLPEIPDTDSPSPSSLPTSSLPTSSLLPPSSPTPTPPPQPWDKYRLPETLKPEHYDLLLWPRLDKDPQKNYYFTGSSTVFFRCHQDTDVILIHCNKLTLAKWEDGELAKLHTTDDSPPPKIERSWLTNDTQYLVIKLRSKLSSGTNYSLSTEFEGALADDLSGFYRSEYINEHGKTRVIATTQMQPTDARKAFPCFDEPAMKATFNITLKYKEEYKAISNMLPLDNYTVTENKINWKVTTFNQTPKMSTYLLAFIVSDFEYLNEIANGTLIRIWARKQAIDEGQGNYALNVTGKILQFFESYYNITYPLPKSDQIALPDFNAGAMENWGLVTYRETALLYHPDLSSAGNKERVLKVIAHELAHQWFGNLVTIKWWNDLWLNEGFASYVEYLGADKVEQGWNVKDLIVLKDVYKVFAIDALTSSHPLSSDEIEINTPAEINELFDAISYSKGASILRMLSNFLTERVFVKGLNAYLQKFSYGNTVYTDLFGCLQEAVNESNLKLPGTINEIMSRWTRQMGFPVVTIDTKSGHVSQKHFLLDPNSTVTRPSKYNYTWIVPITWMKRNSAPQTDWLLNSQGLFPIMNPSGDEWILANINVTGYYRVNYDEENWKKLVNHLLINHTDLPVINRAQIMADSFNLARAKYRNTTAALETTRYLSKELEYIPWEAALENLAYFQLMFDRNDVFGPMRDYMRQQVENLYNHFKTETNNWTKFPDSLMDQYSMINAVRVACGHGLLDCQEMAQAFYRKWMNNSMVNPIPVDLKSSVYCNAIALGNEKQWDFAWKMLQKTTIATEADKLRSALACTKQSWLLNRYLEYTLDTSKIRKQDATKTIISIARNVIGQPLAWDFIRAKWKYIYQQYGGGSFSFSSLIKGVTERFSTEFELQQLEQFKKDNQEIGFGSGTRALEQALENTKANIKWVDENKDSVKKWFITAVKPQSSKIKSLL
ncbi:aminopeptidase N-like [Carcharodon carcharias]|uniref:aminopeptidase N-like n=1 Tax=Carcharodon carcharias TaxID=13397 RepID=UPI001B7E91D8|nr:aminopeptidase N-like [Carcharodon carcharias]